MRLPVAACPPKLPNNLHFVHSLGQEGDISNKMLNALFVKSKFASLLMQTQCSTQYSLLENFTGFLVDFVVV